MAAVEVVSLTTNGAVSDRNIHRNDISISALSMELCLFCINSWISCEFLQHSYT